MSNSFNISVKPDIAAVKAVVDAVRATDVPNIQTNIDANETKIDANKTIVDLIRFTDFPYTNSLIAANESKIDTIDGIADAIKLKTDLIPQNVRGSWAYAQLTTSSGTLVDLLNITGQGILHSLMIKLQDVADTLEIVVTPDSNPFAAKTLTGTIADNWVFPAPYTANVDSKILASAEFPTNRFAIFNLSFDTSLLIQLRRSAGTANTVSAKVYYTVDDF